MSMMGKRLGAIFASALLVAALNPAAAFAGELAPGEVAQQRASVQIQGADASKQKTVYVVTGVKAVADDGYGNKNRTSEVYDYNADNLVKRHVKVSGGNSKTTTKWQYNGSNLASRVKSDGYSTHYSTFKTTATGKITSVATTIPSKGFLKGRDSTISTKLSFSGGKPSRASVVNKYWAMVRYVGGTSMNLDNYGIVARRTSERYYYNKQGLMRALKPSAENTRTTKRFSYDKQGNVKKASEYSTRFFDNKYNKEGRLTKRVIEEGSTTTTVTYTWKKANVKASIAGKVEAQQWAIVNGNMNFALGEDVSSF